MTRRVLISILLPAAVALVGCQSKPEPKAPAESQGAAVTVRTVSVSSAQWPDYYDAVGTVRARTAAQVSARVMGIAREVLVRVGDRVRQGQRLVVVDAQELDARQRQSDAGLAEAQAAKAAAQSAVASAKANLDLAESTFRRMKDLHDKRSISDQEFDEASSRVRVASANMAVAVSQQSQVESKIAQAVEQTAASRIQRGYAAIDAPFAGVVTEKTVEPGNMVVPGAPLMTIERDGALRLEASVAEGNLASIRTGQRAEVAIDSLDRAIEGTVSEIVPAVDAAARAFIVKVDLPLVPNLRSGLFGRARFATGNSTVIAVPTNAVVERGQMHWVFIADGTTARGRLVTLGKRYGEHAEVLSGLAAGERIVAPAPPELADGSRLEVRQ